jgi:hypothetical protein
MSEESSLCSDRQENTKFNNLHEGRIHSVVSSSSGALALTVRTVGLGY